MSHGALLDLVCGPVSPLPETYQRYRLVAHLGSGGQADVYRAVRLCGGVSSAPMTVKVFRVDPHRPLVDELRSWDKGDAALMDLNNRGVGGICRRADGFYGPPPHRPGERPATGDAVPYQIYDYLHGVNLREYVTQRAGLVPGARRLNAVAALTTLSGVLQALHHPQESGATPVLHMDVKPSNVMILTSGDARLIDFTGARYWREEEITQIAYTPESGGPEAFGGVRYVGPAYDVHGFGAVAYYLVTGAYPRVDGRGSVGAQRGAGGDRGAGGAGGDRGAGGAGGAGGDRGAGGAGRDSSPAPWSVLRRHPMLESQPLLRDHLHALLADRPGDRPDTRELPRWVAGLGELARRSQVADVGVDWREPERADSGRAVGRARPSVSGTETDAYQRIERLERELVELRAVAGPGAVPPGANGGAGHGGAGHGGAGHGGALNGGPPGGSAPTMVGAPTRVGASTRAGAPTMVGAPMPAPVSPAGGPQMRGRARVVAKPAPEPTGMVTDPTGPAERWRPPPGERARSLKVGWELTGTGAVIAFICWGIWAASSEGRMTGPMIAFVLVLAVAAGVFALTRLIGRLVLEQRMGRIRRGAKGAHALTGLFLLAAGVAYIRQVDWVMTGLRWLGDNLW